MALPYFFERILVNFDRGIMFDFDNANVNLSCNDLMGTQDIGLYYTIDAVTGFQFDRGNQWLGIFNQWGAQHELPSTNIMNNQFRARNNTSEWPTTISPLTGWFNISMVIPSCPSDPECEDAPGEGMKEQPTELDQAIAEGGLQGPEGLVWDMQKYLYAQLQQYPALATGNTAMQNFLSGNQNSALAQLYTIEAGIRGLFQPDAASQSELDANIQAIQTKQGAIQDIREALSDSTQSAQHASLLQQLQQLESDVSTLIQQNAAIYSGLHDARVLQADALLSTNSAIAATGTCQLNEQSFFEVYLNTAGKDTRLATETQLTTLRNIATQCPTEGGRAVYWAAGLLGNLSGEIVSIRNCQEVGSRSSNSQSEPNVVEKQDFNLFPNPSSGACTIEFDLEENLSCQLIIFNTMGREVARKTISSEIDHWTLPELPSGYYIVSLVFDDGNVISKPFIRK